LHELTSHLHQRAHAREGERERKEREEREEGREREREGERERERKKGFSVLRSVCFTMLIHDPSKSIFTSKKEHKRGRERESRPPLWIM